jgi:hypothetical protein
VGASVVPDGGVPTAQPPLAGEEGGEEGRLPNPARLHPLALAILLFPVVGRAVPSPYRYPARDPVEQHINDLPFCDGDGAAGASVVPDGSVPAAQSPPGG